MTIADKILDGAPVIRTGFEGWRGDYVWINRHATTFRVSFLDTYWDIAVPMRRFVTGGNYKVNLKSNV